MQPPLQAAPPPNPLKSPVVLHHIKYTIHQGPSNLNKKQMSPKLGLNHIFFLGRLLKKGEEITSPRILDGKIPVLTTRSTQLYHPKCVKMRVKLNLKSTHPSTVQKKFSGSLTFHESSWLFNGNPYFMVSLVPIPSMYGTFTYFYLIFMVNVGKYTIHGWYGV